MRRLAPLAVVLGLALAACGDDDGASTAGAEGIDPENQQQLAALVENHVEGALPASTVCRALTEDRLAELGGADGCEEAHREAKAQDLDLTVTEVTGTPGETATAAGELTSERGTEPVTAELVYAGGRAGWQIDSVVIGSEAGG